MSPDMPLQGAHHGTPKTVLWIVIVIFIAGVIGLSYYLYQNDDGNSPGNLNTNTGVNQNTNVSTAPSGWATYSDSEFGFSFQHPQDYRVNKSGDTINVAASGSQESAPLFTAVQGDYDDGLAWLNSVKGSRIQFASTGEQLIVDERTGTVVSNEGNERYLIVEFPRYTLVAFLPGPLIDRDGSFQEILKTFRD